MFEARVCRRQPSLAHLSMRGHRNTYSLKKNQEMARIFSTDLEPSPSVISIAPTPFPFPFISIYLWTCRFGQQGLTTGISTTKATKRMKRDCPTPTPTHNILHTIKLNCVRIPKDSSAFLNAWEVFLKQGEISNIYWQTVHFFQIDLKIPQ